MKLIYNDKENALLDAAMELFTHYGYDKTTVSEIAKKTGISKGAVYLNFDSKKAIMDNLLFRESQKYNRRWLQLVDEDPQGGLLSGMYRNILSALLESPLISSYFCKNNKILDGYLNENDQTSYGELIRADFIKELQEVGAVRSDVDPVETAHIMDMLAFAFVRKESLKAVDTILDIGDIIKSISEMMDRAFTPEDGGDSNAGKQVLHKLIDEAINHYEKESGQKYTK